MEQDEVELVEVSSNPNTPTASSDHELPVAGDRDVNEDFNVELREVAGDDVEVEDDAEFPSNGTHDAATDDDIHANRPHNCGRAFCDKVFMLLNWITMSFGLGLSLFCVYLMVVLDASVISISFTVYSLFLFAVPLAFGPTCKDNIAFCGS